jgi:acyl carrier protein
MDINDFIKNFADQFDTTDASEFSADTDYRQLEEWDSMIALSIIAMVDEKYGVSISGEEMRATKTVQELFDVVKQKKG